MTKDPLQTLCEGRHPLYEENIAHWNFLEATYDGGREWFAGNIFQFIKEGNVEFKKRLERAYRFNHTKQVVDQVDKYLFKMAIARNLADTPEHIKNYWAAATLSGLDIDTLFNRVSTLTSIYGRIWLVVDSTASPEVVSSVADEKASGAKIYSYPIRPQDMLDMSYDELNELNWALCREYSRDDDNPMDSSREMRERYRLWTRTSWTLIEKKVQRGKVRYIEIGKGEHDLGFVPLIQADHVFSEEPYEAPGLIDDIAYLDRAIANYLSNLDAIIQDQTFSQLAMPAQGLLPGEEGSDKLIDMSTKRVFLFNGENGSVPFYLSPDPKQAELILSAIAKIINEIYHSIGLSSERSKESSGVDNASGVAKSIDFERVNSLLSAKARALQKTERALVDVVHAYSGKTGAVDAAKLVTYPLDFDVRSVYDEFEIAARLMLLTAPDELRREQMRLVIAKLFPALSSEQASRLEKALKDWPPEEIAVDGLGAPKPVGAKSSGAPVKAAGAQKVAKELAS